MKQAYVISAYKLPEQLVRLVKKINNENTIILIHVDKNSNNDYMDSLKNQLGEFENVIFLKRHRCQWGDYGHVAATVKAIRYLIENDIDFDYFNVITGQDYPIQSLENIDKFFKNKSMSYIEYFKLPSAKWNNSMERIGKIHIQLRGRRIILPESISNIIHSKLLRLSVQNKKGFSFYGGSGYFSLNNKHTKYIYKFLDENRDYEKFFKYTFISDEIFFQTILLNSRFKSQIINNNLRLIDWNGPVNYPKIFTSKDFGEIKNSKALFARKFDSSVDGKIITMIDDKLSNERTV